MLFGQIDGHWVVFFVLLTPAGCLAAVEIAPVVVVTGPIALGLAALSLMHADPATVQHPQKPARGCYQ